MFQIKSVLKLNINMIDVIHVRANYNNIIHINKKNNKRSVKTFYSKGIIIFRLEKTKRNKSCRFEMVI